MAALFDALLRSQSEVTVFVDALCINQRDLREKAEQVRRIGDVYAHADRVVVWLGAGDSVVGQAFRFMREGMVGEGVVGRSSDVVDALMALLKRRWFQRVWVVQEVILGSNIAVACGDDVVDFETLKDAVLSLWECDESVGFFDIRHPAYLGFRCATRLFALCDEFRKNGRICLEALFEAIFYYSATDSRDFVFAIRGIAKSVEFLPDPDYTASIEAVFTHTAENILCKGKSLDLLSMCGLGPIAQASDFLEYCGKPRQVLAEQLPSWVPDFRQLAYNEPMLACEMGDWDASGPLGESPSRNGNGLQVDVVVLDTIARVSDEIDTMEFDPLRSSLLDVLDTANSGLDRLSSRHISDTVWRTLVMDRDLDDEPALPELGLAFEDLLQGLDEGREWEDIEQNEFYRIIRVRTDSWCTFTSRKGYFGVTWPLIREGDLLCLLPGCRFPLVIRPVDTEAPSSSKALRRGALIGWCYVHGIMHGEAIRKRQEVERMVLV